jgi:hypothetical protein
MPPPPRNVSMPSFLITRARSATRRSDTTHSTTSLTSSLSWSNSVLQRQSQTSSGAMTRGVIRSTDSGFFCSIAMMTSPFLDSYEPLDVIGNGSFGIIHKLRRKTDGVVRAIGGTSCSQTHSCSRRYSRARNSTLTSKKQIVTEVCALTDPCNFTTN